MPSGNLAPAFTVASSATHHHVAAVDRRRCPATTPAAGRAAALVVDAVRRPQPELEERRARIAQRRDALARRELALLALLLLRLGTAALAQTRLFFAKPRYLGAPVPGALLELSAGRRRFEDGHTFRRLGLTIWPDSTR